MGGRRYTGWYNTLAGIEKYDRNCNYRDFGIGWLLISTTDSSKRDNGRLRVINYQFKADCEN